MPTEDRTVTPSQNNTPSLPDRIPLDEMFDDLKKEDLVYKRSTDPESPGRREKIQINNVPLDDQTSIALRSLYAFNIPPKLFSRGASICRVRYDERNVAVIEPLDHHGVRYYLARSAFFIKLTKDSKDKWHETHVSPPIDVTHDVMETPDHEFPQLIALSETPIIKENGDIATTPGYEPESMLYFSPTNGCSFPTISSAPTDGEIVSSIDLIKEVICDFPFVDDESRANALAALITPILRPIIPGCVPMCVIDKPQAGTGASLLCDAIAIIATGNEMATITEQKTEEEWQKVITSILRDGKVLVTVDNVEGKLYAPTLASLLTATTYQGRILGKSEMVTFPNRTVWIANGNNIQLGGDLPRRCFSVRMDAKTAQPWLRKVSFQHPSLRDWVKENRGWLVCSILTLAKGWIAAGRPAPKNPKILGGFEGWCTVIEGILNFAGVSSFLGNLEQMYENMDRDTTQWEGFLSAWREIYKENEIGVADIYDRLKRETDSREALIQDQILHSAMPDWMADEFNKKSSFVRKLGMALSKKDGTCFSCGLKLERCGTRHRAVMWRVTIWDEQLWKERLDTNDER